MQQSPKTHSPSAHLRVSDVCGARSVSKASASSSLTPSNLPVFRVKRACRHVAACLTSHVQAEVVQVRQVRKAAVPVPWQHALRPPQCTTWSRTTSDSLAASQAGRAEPTFLARSSLRSLTSKHGPLSLPPSADAAAASVAALLLRLCRPAALEPRTEAGRLPRLATELVRDGSLISGTLTPAHTVSWSAGRSLSSHQQANTSQGERVLILQGCC